MAHIPYGVAVTVKGRGFYGEGSLPAHNLPLPGNPRTNPEAARLFNESARKLWVPVAQLERARERFQHHEASKRPRERDHVLATRQVRLEDPPEIPERRMSGDCNPAQCQASEQNCFCHRACNILAGRAGAEPLDLR
jgi:phosphoketolase